MSDAFRLDRYLERIGHPGPARPDLATLRAIHAAQASALPFEALDPLLGRPVPLDLASVQRKMVDGHRGGYCFEQNTLLKAALEAIGFTVTGLGGRVRWMSAPGAPLGPRTHMLLKVDLAEGAWLADTGFGACILDSPIRFETGTEQRTAMGTFRLDDGNGLYTLNALQPSGWRAMYAFTLEPQQPSDYDLANWFTSTHPQSRFVGTLILERVTGTERRKLLNRRFVIEARDGQIVSEREIATADALRRVLEEEFRITPPEPVGQILARIPA